MDAELLSETFVELTDTMVAGFDVIDFLHVLTDRSVQLLDVSAAGLLLADPRGELRVVAASSEAARLLELFQLQTALNSRVLIEQAKGKLAERLGVDMDQAFALLRDRARAGNRRLSDLARAFIDGTEPLTAPDAGPGRSPRSSGRPPGATGGR